MTTDLRQALHDLADDRPPAAPPADLWTRGVRRARRRRAGGLVAAVVAVVGVLVTGLPVQRTAPQPADLPVSRLHIPDHLYRLSAWARGTDDLGPPGPVAVLMRESDVRRRWWFGTRDAMVAVSAVDGSYRYLDLPDADLGTEPRLSPDGLKVGYVLTGDVPDGAHSSLVGLAVYDTVTGDVVRHRFPSRYGLVVDALGWTSGSDYLVGSVGQNLAQEGSSTDYRLTALGLDGRIAQLGDRESAVGPFGFGQGGGISWMDDKDRIVTWQPPAGHLTRVQTDLRGSSGPVFGPDGSAFVTIASGPAGPHSWTNRFFTGRSGSPGELLRTRLLAPAWQGQAVLGWIDEHRVLAVAHPAWGNGYRIVTVDLRTGVAKRAIPVERERRDYLLPQVAGDLVANPLVPGRRPPSHVDPRPVAFGLAALLVVAWLLVRGRRGAR